MANCIVCNGDRTTRSFYPKLAFNNKIFEYRKCKNCRLVFLVPSLTDDDTEKLYDTGYHEEFYFKTEPGRNKERQSKLLMQYKPGGNLLDYGCGDASFLRFLRNRGYELNGAEYQPKLVDKLSISFPDIKFYSITSLTGVTERKFDIIHLCDVLGQVADPNGVIESLRAHLAPGGVLFVESPVEHNVHVFYLFRAAYFKLRKWLKPGRIVAGKPFRVMFSNRRNQELFFKNNGYRTLHYEIFEWAWPFPDEWQAAKSWKQKIGFIMGAVSKFFSKRIRNWGNRFYYIGTPDETYKKRLQ
jgi:2-polyprenyl-3-methyl-5-hydroxy-6-metoxy-1,4-benzoquinol methylase